MCMCNRLELNKQQQVYLKHFDPDLRARLFEGDLVRISSSLDLNVVQAVLLEIPPKLPTGTRLSLYVVF